MTFETVANIVALVAITTLTVIYHYGKHRFARDNNGK
jgi:hypothetical protein